MAGCVHCETRPTFPRHPHVGPAELVVTTVASRQSDTYVTCEKCDRLFKAGRFKDGSIPTACPTCRVGVDPAGQSISIDTESRF